MCAHGGRLLKVSVIVLGNSFIWFIEAEMDIDARDVVPFGATFVIQC